MQWPGQEQAHRSAAVSGPTKGASHYLQNPKWTGPRNLEYMHEPAHAEDLIEGHSLDSLPAPAIKLEISNNLKLEILCTECTPCALPLSYSLSLKCEEFGKCHIDIVQVIYVMLTHWSILMQGEFIGLLCLIAYVWKWFSKI